MAGFNINTAGFIIVGMFVVTWAAALAIWSFGKVWEKWSRKLPSVESVPTDLEAQSLRPDHLTDKFEQRCLHIFDSRCLHTAD